VEVVAEATEEALATFEERLREGPAFAAVASLDRAPVPLRDGERGFQIR
jgi:acylphosphatase